MTMLKIITAGVLSLPCFVVAIGVAPVLALLAIPPVLFLLFQTEDKDDNNGGASASASAVLPDHVIITGGSSGIGFSIAKECVKRGVPKISLLARDPEKLQTAKALLESMSNNKSTATTASGIAKCQVTICPVNVSDYEALVKTAKSLYNNNNNNNNSSKSDDKQQQLQQERVVLWNCAGFAYPTEFEKMPIAKFEQQVMTNQLGAIYVVKAFLPYLTKGCIVLTSSAAGQLGVYGYTSYAPTKFALRGFAETLHSELILSHPQLSIQLAFPTDTNTPGYQEELKVCPEITRKLSETGSLVSPDDTAKAMVNAAFCKNPKFAVHFTLEGWMLANVTAGMSPVTNLSDAIVQVALGGVLRLIGLFVLNDWWNTIRGYRDEQQSQQHTQPQPVKDTDSKQD